jgi:hypothetical protein
MPRKKTSAGKQEKASRTIQTSLYIPEEILRELQKVRVEMGLPRDNAFYLAAIKEKLAKERRKK